MKGRCFNPNDKDYKDYGGRGITVCPEWHESFDMFLLCVGSRPEGTSISRIDNDGNYDPWNCEWAALGVQSQNQRPLAGGTSKYKGVSWSARRNKWEACLQANGEKRWRDWFEIEEDAAHAYDEAAYAAYGESVWLNRDHFPELRELVAA